MCSDEYTPYILVVDDSSLNLTVVGKMLTCLAYRWSAVESGDAALQQLREQHFDLVLMDCMMPDLDGFETTRMIRDPANTVLNRQVPIIAVTAHVTAENRNRCHLAGMNDFIEKPISAQRLSEVIQKWCGTHKKQSDQCTSTEVKQGEMKPWFAPAGRASADELKAEQEKAAHSVLIKTLLNAMPDYLLVLNSNRQIVVVNERLLSAFGVVDPESLLGLRPGEAVNCVHFSDGPDGCGTARNCAVCGAVLAVLASQDTGLPQRRECQLMMGGQDGCKALDLDVLATPVTIEGEAFTVLALRDISSEKRRYVMERVFFHDILNNAGGIRGLAALLVDGTNPAAEEEYKGWMVNLADNLIEEINHQRRLLSAERGDYQPVFEEVDLGDLLQDVKRLYENHERTLGRIIEIDEEPTGSVLTDRPLLRRIIGNMVLNALEAAKPGDRVTIWGHCQAERVRISVSNPGEIPLHVQLSLFKRSFSTKKEAGRGLGTYSMKLFGERYLGGVVDFRSNNDMTTFFIELPSAQDVIPSYEV